MLRASRSANGVSYDSVDTCAAPLTTRANLSAESAPESAVVAVRAEVLSCRYRSEVGNCFQIEFPVNQPVGCDGVGRVSVAMNWCRGRPSVDHTPPMAASILADMHAMTFNSSESETWAYSAIVDHLTACVAPS